MKLLIIFYFVFFSIFGFAQNTKTLRLKKYKVATLSDTIRETSGLNFFDEKLYTFNDSGNTSELFEIDKNSGKILNILKTDLKNKDWEALTNDGSHFYIGDFGNNLGTRKDLKIYKIPFVNDTLKLDSIKIISFNYPEQIDFSRKNISNNFDAEAMIFLGGNIHLFTKEWETNTVSHYFINPEIAENQSAKKSENFDTGFVVTDSAYFRGKLYFVGYKKNTDAFLMIFNETEPGIFFNEKPRKYFLGSTLTIGQIEGIAVDENGIYISGEEFTKIVKITQSLYFVPFKDLE